MAGESWLFSSVFDSRSNDFIELIVRRSDSSDGDVGKSVAGGCVFIAGREDGPRES